MKLSLDNSQLESTQIERHGWWILIMRIICEINIERNKKEQRKVVDENSGDKSVRRHVLPQSIDRQGNRFADRK